MTLVFWNIQRDLVRYLALEITQIKLKNSKKMFKQIILERRNK